MEVRVKNKTLPCIHVLTPLQTWTIKLQQMMEQIMILNRDNSRREKHLWMEIKLNHMQDKTKFFFLQKLHSIPILLYGSESRCLNKPSTFHTKSLGRILSLWIYWPKTIPNQDLFNRCQQEDMTTKIARRRVETGLVIYLKRLGQHYQKKRF